MNTWKEQGFDSPYAYYPGTFPLLHFNEVLGAINWVNRDGAPRDESFMALEPSVYTYGRGRGVRTYHSEPMPEVVRIVRDALHQDFGWGHDLCFANYYADEHKHLGWHADDSKDIDHRFPIVVVSFGATRDILIRPNPGLLRWETPEERVALEHGSILVMRAGMQQTHQHRIPKVGRQCGPRVSLTFRKSL